MHYVGAVKRIRTRAENGDWHRQSEAVTHTVLIDREADAYDKDLELLSKAEKIARDS